MSNYITFDIKALEDLKMGSSGSQIDNEYALNYISGSSIRGAFIGGYLSEKKLSSNDLSNDKNLMNILLRKIKFLNAYIEENSSRTMPTPLCLYANKNDIRKFEKKGKIKVNNEFDVTGIGEEDKRFTGGDFCRYKNEGLEVTNVKKSVNLHVNTRKEDSNLFRYESIEKGQIFKGIIYVEDDAWIDQVKEVLDNKVFYLGGSRGSGYGKCLIENMFVTEENIEREDFKIEDSEDYDEELYILALSDIISRDDYGNVISYIDDNCLKEKLSLKSISLDKSATQCTVVSGYNAKWKGRYPQIMAIKRGSVFKYSYDGDLDIESIKFLEDKGIGDRTEEGYGRVLILSELDINKIEKFKNKVMDEQVTITKESSKKQLKEILNLIYINAAEREIDLKVLEFKDAFKNKMGNSQIGKIIELAQNAKSMSSKDGKEYLGKYFKNIEAKTNNKRVGNSIIDSKVDSRSFKDYIYDFIENSDDVEKFNSSTLISRKKISIAGIDVDIDKEYVYKYNMQLLERMFKFIRVKGGAKDEYKG